PPSRSASIRTRAAQPGCRSRDNGPGRFAHPVPRRRASPNGGPGRRRSMRGLLLPLAFLLMSGFTRSDVGDAPEDQPAMFKITTRQKDDSVEVRADKDKTLFPVKSPFGISQAVIEREGEKWPKAVVLRLHLKGLSNFRAWNGKVTVDAAVSIEEGKR